MKTVPMLLLLCVAAGSAYPLNGAARDEDNSMELVQVTKGGGPHTHSQG